MQENSDSMDNKQKGSIIMFCAGVGMAVAAAIMFLGDYLVESNFPIILLIMGIVFMGASNFHLLKTK